MSEAEENGGEWTRLRIWLHPGRALDAIDGLELLCADLGRRLDGASACAGRLEAELERLRESAAEKDAGLARLSCESENLRREVADLRASLDERKDVERQIQEFDEKLKGIENMKRDYEKTIRDLNLRLRDYRRRSGQDCGSDLLEPGETIDMSHVVPRESVREPDSVPGVAQGSTVSRMGAKTADRKTVRESPDDWLIDLPDSL